MTKRKSNIELLRIISMAMVLAVHLDGASLGLPHPAGNIVQMSSHDWWRLVVEALMIIGVNCFTLISGYFGIKANWRGFLKLSATCLFYSVGIYLVLIVSGMLPWRWAEFMDSVLIYTHSDLWYVPAYLGLYVLSPVLNSAIKYLEQKQFLWMLLSFVAFNVYCGWMWGASFNATGYTIMQLIMMYLIGQYIGRYGHDWDFGNKTYLYPIIYVGATALIVVNSLYDAPLHAFAYNSPFVIISSVTFFMWFATMKIESSAINTLATSAFAVYLLHKNPYIWRDIIKPSSIYLWEHLSLLEFTLAVIFLIVVIYLLTFVVDRLRLYLMSKLFANNGGKLER